MLNGGVGSRFGADKPKQLVRIKQVPMFIYSIRAAIKVPAIERIVINYPVGWKEVFRKMIEDYGLGGKVEFVSAGSTRQQSVLNLLESISEGASESVIIHEAARPLISSEDFQNLIEDPHSNVSFGVKIPFTVLQLDESLEFINRNLERDQLVNVQLPQKFEMAELIDAHRKAHKDGIEFTEDASLVHHYGGNVKFIKGNDYNIKVTNAVDRNVVEFLMDDEHNGYIE